MAAVEQFMKTAIDWFESSGMVERWAWFGAFESEASGGNINGVENSDGSVSLAAFRFVQSLTVLSRRTLWESTT